MSKYNEILSNINAAVPELSDPQNMNPSQADLLIKIASGITPTIDNVIAELGNTVTIITDLVGNGGYCKPGYFVQKALAYQAGDSLVMDADTFEMYYPVINTVNKIVVQAAYIRTLTSDGNFYVNSIKVAKIDPNNPPKLTRLTNGILPDTTNELSAFSSYMLNFDPPGSHVSCYSLLPNILTLGGTPVVTYYFGYNLDNLKAQISAQLQIFKQTFTFNGIFFVNELSSFLKENVQGLRNVTFPTCLIDGVDFTSVGETPLTSGYFEYYAPGIVLTSWNFVFI